MRIPKFLRPCGSRPGEPDPQGDVDLREEYANAFRTESYNEFWARVLSLTADLPSSASASSSAAAARLLSYRLFAELLLDPDQSSATNALDLASLDPDHNSLLRDYFSETAGASFLSGSLLKDVDRIRTQYRSLKSHLQLTPPGQFPSVPPRLSELLESCTSSFPSDSISRIQSTQRCCSELLKRLESGRDKAKARIRSINRMQKGSAVLLVALTVSLTVVIATHGLALIAAAPGLVPASIERMISSKRRWMKAVAQLDAAAKGTYTLTRDVDTISRLVARAGDEAEHVREMVRFWAEKGKEGGRAGRDVAVEVGKNNKGCSLVEQMDELEEQLYLCFMTINRARKLVMDLIP